MEYRCGRQFIKGSRINRLWNTSAIGRAVKQTEWCYIASDQKSSTWGNQFFSKDLSLIFWFSSLKVTWSLPKRMALTRPFMLVSVRGSGDESSYFSFWIRVVHDFNVRRLFHERKKLKGFEAVNHSASRYTVIYTIIHCDTMTIFMTSPHACCSRSKQSSSRRTNTGENGAVMNREEFMRRKMTKTHVERRVVSGDVNFEK